MGAFRRLVPHQEIIVHRPSESFRWNVHDYPHHLAKWHMHPEYELHLIQGSSGTMMVGDHVGPFADGCLVLTGPDVPHNWVSETPAGGRIPDRDVLIQFTQGFADRVFDGFPELEAVRTLLAEAAYGVLFHGETSRAGAALLNDIGRARGPRRLVLFLELMSLLAEDPAERSTLSRRARTLATHQVEERIETALGYIAENYASEIRLLHGRGPLRHGGERLLPLVQEADRAHLRQVREPHPDLLRLHPPDADRPDHHRHLLRGGLQQHRELQSPVRQVL